MYTLLFYLLIYAGMKKIWKIIPAVVATAVPFLTQVTMSGATVSLSADELSSMWTALTDGWSSLVNVGIQLLPYLVAFTIIMMVFGLIKNLWNLRAKWGWKWRIKTLIKISITITKRTSFIKNELIFSSTTKT